MARIGETEKKVRKMIMDQVLSDGTCPPREEIAEEHSLSVSELDNIFLDLEANICVAVQNKTHAGMKYFQEEMLDVPAPKLGEIFYARPFATFKNHYPIWVDGKQKWYGECAVEGCGISGMFPGKEVILRSICRQTKEPVELIQRDGKLIEYSPKTLRVHIGIPIRYFPDDVVGWCDYNSFFSSKEALDEWKKTHPGVKGITRDPVTVSNFISLIGKGRLNYDYQPEFPIWGVLFRANKYGFTKQWPVLRYFLFDPFWMPSPHMVMEMRRKGYKNFSRFSLY